jgi:GH25 family lysozyme M1 (1,4-beta-N-acetylmuramidase)
LGRKPVIYGGDLLKQQLGNKKDAFFGGHRLWLAQYGNHPKVQPSWDTFWLWQYTDGESGPDPKAVPGIPGDSKGRLDCDHFVGTPAQLTEQWAS